MSDTDHTDWQPYVSVYQGHAGDAMRPPEPFHAPRIVAERTTLGGVAMIRFCDGSMVKPADAQAYGWQIEPLARDPAQRPLQRVAS